MRKEILKRAAAGSFVGIAIGQVISVIISFCIGTGEFIVCAPEFIESLGNEMTAGAIQTLLCAVMGAGFAGASVIWECEKLNIAAQTGICFGIYSLVLFPIAYFSYWMEHTVTGFMTYFGIFFVSFVVIWIAKYFAWRSRINAINKKIGR